jgi:hypothetical protein
VGATRYKLPLIGGIQTIFTGYAYETIPNKPIITGRTHGRDDATLGRLARGASGVTTGPRKD